VVVSPAGDFGFNATISELKAQGYNRTDRIYLAFVDTTAAGTCGIGTLWSDDRPTSDNRNNAGPSYSRVDAGCWSGSVAAHELMHNLGGVQHSAPHASGGFHCIDEYDVMCYKDSSSSPAMRVDCAETWRNVTRFDCGHDDYFHTNPATGSYLASHWNSANNRFLVASADGPVDPGLPPPVPPAPSVDAAPEPTSQGAHDKKDKKKHKKKGKKHKKGKKKR
jgi:hypothetical protein